MKIVNHTRWRTADIRAVAERVASEELNPEQAKALVIEVFTKGANGARRDRWTRTAATPVKNRAGLRFNYFTLTMPAVTPERAKFRNETLEVYAHRQWTSRAAYRGIILAHEMAECRGKQHADLKGCTRYGYRPRGSKGCYWDFLAQMPMRWDPPVKKVREAPTPLAVAVKKRAAQDARRQQAEAKIVEWTRKQKLAMTFLKKWQRRLRAMQRAHAKAAFQLVQGGVA